MLQPSAPMVVARPTACQKAVPCGGSREGRSVRSRRTSGHAVGVLRPFQLRRAVRCGLMAVFSVAAPESPELPTSRRKQADGKVALRPTIPPDRSGSGRTRSIPKQSIRSGRGTGLRPLKDEQRFAARGRSPTSLYACVSSMRWRPAAYDDDERPWLRLRGAAARDPVRQRRHVLGEASAAVEDADGGMSKSLSGRSKFGLAMAAEMWREFGLGTLCGTEDAARMCGEAAAQRGRKSRDGLGSFHGSSRRWLVWSQL